MLPGVEKWKVRAKERGCSSVRCGVVGEVGIERD